MKKKKKYDNINRDELVSLCERCDHADTCSILVPCSNFVPAVGSNFTETALQMPDVPQEDNEENPYEQI